MLEEIFGEENCISTVCWKNKVSPANDAKYFSDDFDYLICFSKNKTLWQMRGLQREPGQSKYFTNPDNDPRGNWNSATYTCNKSHLERPNLYYPIVHPRTEQEVWPNKTAVWRFSKEKHEELAADNRLYWGKNGDAERPRLKLFESEAGDVTPRSVWLYEEAGHTQGAMMLLMKVLNTTEFQTPKPVELLSRILRLAAADQEALVLDSFAGSGTTAHAVLKANKQDAGNRNVILVEMEDYAERFTAERVRRVINGYSFTGTERTELMREKITWSKLKNSDKLTEKVERLQCLHSEEYDSVKRSVKGGELIVTGERHVSEATEGLGGSFTYCTLGDPVELDKLLRGETLPPFEGIGAALFHMATNRALDPETVREDDCYLGEADGWHVWLIYRPDLEWLKSPDAALTLTRAREFAETAPEDRHLVFAPARYVSQKMLVEQNVPVEFVPLPFALYRIDPS